MPDLCALDWQWLALGGVFVGWAWVLLRWGRRG